MASIRLTELTELRAQKTALEIEKLRHEVAIEAARAKVAEIDQLVAEEQEADRLVRPANTGKINFFAPISSANVDKVIEALEHWEARDDLSGNGRRDITLTFNSQGGSVTDGLALFDTIQRLRRKGHHVTTRGIGVVASMAAVLLQAGDERVLDKRAKVLIHEGSTTFGQGATLTRGEREDYERFSDMLLEDIIDILTERSNCSREEIDRRWKRTDWWLRAPEAVELGFADRIE